ncbi:MAG: GNAT family N-acetyltransferase [Pseudomonadota bacterium]|nr:GNAT family N-acetyltransferase [Pseudomonadota bacterium]
MSQIVALPFAVGARTLGSVRRRLVRRSLSLAEALAGVVPALPPLPDRADGYLVTSLPASLAQRLAEGDPALKPFVRHRYYRSYVSLETRFEDYLAAFSAKSRSTLKRKLRRLAERSGGALDVRCYRRPDEMADFHRHARAVSALTYQERLLGAGLPEDGLERMQALAARDGVRGWILFLDRRPISYLHAPAEVETLVYAHLGYDPAFADLSPGTVLQLEALRHSMEERRFRLFDFTEGDGAHKTRFATGAVDCLDLLLLRRTFGNIAAAGALAGFDAAVRAGKAAARRMRLESLARSALR